MTDAKDNSSLPLLMSITGAVLVVAVGGWFFLGQDERQPERSFEPPPELASSPVAEAAPVAEESVDEPVANTDAEESAEVAPQEEQTVAVSVAPANEVDVELRKARLAADAGLLIYPADQSAFHYYGQALAIEPYHAVASAELDAVLASVANTVSQHMEAAEYAEAYAISQIVASLRPEHQLVINTQRAFDQMTEELVAEAVQNARNGKDADAEQLLSEAANLPGRNADYFVAIRESVAEIRETRVAAERDRARRAQLAENEAKDAWMESVRAAISNGNLVAPAGASARDLLDEDDRWGAEKEQLEAEILDAILISAELSVQTFDFDNAELLIAASGNYPDEQEKFDALRTALEEAYIEHESNQVKKVSELVAVKIVQPRYPRAAKMRSTNGWVEIFFTVAPDGNTEEIEISRSVPEDVFDSAAVNAVDNWKFEPVEYRGRVIPQRAAARLVFNVE